MSNPENRDRREGEPKQEVEKSPEGEKRESVLAELGYESRDLTPERINEVREAVAQSRVESEKTLEDRFEKPGNPELRLQFHNRRHSQGVAERARDIAALLVSDDDPAKKDSPEQFAAAVERLQLAAEVVALDHDRVNTSIIVEVADTRFGPNGPEPVLRADGTPFTRKMRKRFLAPPDMAVRDKLQQKKISAEQFGGEALTEDEAAELAKFETIGPLGTNEKDSAKEAQGKLRAILGADGSRLFTGREIGDADTYEATVPGWDGRNGTVAQINLSERTSLIDRATALADLGEAGSDPQGYLLAGDALVLEDHPDIEALLREAAGETVETEPGGNGKPRQKPDEETKRRLVDRLLAFSDSQEGFARGRKARLEGYEVPVDPKDPTKGTRTVSDLDGLPEDIQSKIKGYFNKFDGPEGSIAQAAAVAKKRRKLFEEKPYDEALRELAQEILAGVAEYAKPMTDAERAQ